MTVLIAAGIRELCLIATPLDLPRFRQLLGDGARWGISIDYREQPRPEGIAQAFLIAADFVAGDKVVPTVGGNNLLGGVEFPPAVAAPSRRVDPPRQTGLDIAVVLEADRHTDQVFGDARAGPFRRGQPAVAGHCIVDVAQHTANRAPRLRSKG